MHTSVFVLYIHSLVTGKAVVLFNERLTHVEWTLAQTKTMQIYSISKIDFLGRRGSSGSAADSITEAEKARFVALPLVRLREAEKARSVAKLGPVMRFSGCSAKAVAKCIRTVVRAWAYLAAGWEHGLRPGSTDRSRSKKGM